MILNFKEMIASYQKSGLSVELASARVCQDVVLKAISLCPFGNNVTVKGGVVMQSLTQNIRRSTRDVDLVLSTILWRIPPFKNLLKA